MAITVDFQGTNMRLRAPQGDEDRVQPLRCFTNNHVVVTCWKLTPDEMVEVMRTGKIWVAQLSGRTIHPTLVADAETIRELCLDHGGTFPRQTEAAHG